MFKPVLSKYYKSLLLGQHQTTIRVLQTRIYHPRICSNPSLSIALK